MRFYILLLGLGLTLAVAACGKFVEPKTVIIATGTWYVAVDGDKRLLVRPLEQTIAPERAKVQWAVLSVHGAKLEVSEAGVWTGLGTASFGTYQFGWSYRSPGCGYLYIDRWLGRRGSHSHLDFVPADAEFRRAAELVVNPEPTEQTPAYLDETCV
jgi:hypothetical protein